MAANLSKQEREQKISITANLYLKGHRQTDIANIIGVTQQQVSYYIKEIQKRWLEAQIKSFDQAKAVEIEKINHIESKAWEAFEKSKQKRIKDKSGEIHEYEDGGDAKFLQIALNCIDRRVKILGLDREKPTESGSNGSVVILPTNMRENPIQYSEAQLDELIKAAKIDGYEDAEIID